MSEHSWEEDLLNPKIEKSDKKRNIDNMRLINNMLNFKIVFL